jgi:RNA polymerase sigma-70 factor, ECF subfamily
MFVLRSACCATAAQRAMRTRNRVMHEQMNDSTSSVEHLYQEHRRPILAYLTRLIDDREAAEDLCQETFLKALRSWAQHDQSASPIAWLYRIATNTAYDHLRRRRRAILMPLVEALPGGYTPELWLGERELVHSALAQLPAHYRVPLLLQVCAGHSLSEIADALGCTPSAIKMRLLRARERFRQLYQG